MVISLIIFASQALQEIRTCMHGTNKPPNGKKKKKAETLNLAYIISSSTFPYFQ
jgi:hypothetical protein